MANGDAPTGDGIGDGMLEYRRPWTEQSDPIKYSEYMLLKSQENVATTIEQGCHLGVVLLAVI